MEYIVKILDLKRVTHDVKNFKVEMPDDQMIQDLNTTLETLGARPESLVFEK